MIVDLGLVQARLGVPTKREALAYIRDGALNGIELLEEAGLTTAEAEAELARLKG